MAIYKELAYGTVMGLYPGELKEKIKKREPYIDNTQNRQFRLK